MRFHFEVCPRGRPHARPGRCIFAALHAQAPKPLKALHPKQLPNLGRRVSDLLSADELASLGRGLSRMQDAGNSRLKGKARVNLYDG